MPLPELALTLWEPFASGLVYGPKNVENRPWPPPSSLMGKRFWVHASARYDLGGFVDSEEALRELWPDYPRIEDAPRQAIIGSVELVGVAAKLAGGGLRGPADP